MRRALVLVMVAALAAGGCKKKPAEHAGPSPELTGLAVVPSTAEVIVGVDVGRLAESPIVTRAVEQLLAREPSLAEKWQDLRNLCKLEMEQVSRLMIALGPPPRGGKVGTGPMILIATGKLSEPELVKCVREVVGKGGGSLVVKDVEGRSLYQVKDANRSMYIAFSRSDTVILGNNDAYVNEAIGNGKKALQQPELAGWLNQADQHAPVWVVGRVAEPLKKGLVRASNGMLKAGATAYIGSLDLTSGVKAELRALMGSAEDAKKLESLVNLNLTSLTWAAQGRSLGTVVKKLTVAVRGSEVQFSLPLTMDDVNHLLSALDGDGPPAQDSPPRGG
ncbi:MAG TPA: hypothetical protein VN253_12045, partial [Kofleriaceae bacterium]|nr:hypothetical protein [Kofleriaceae bacterium]